MPAQLAGRLTPEASNEPYAVDVPTGWEQIATDLDAAISAVSPDYQVARVKEKNGTLRFSVVLPASATERDRARVEALIDAAASVSERTCSVCGRPGGEAWTAFVRRTACDLHAAPRS